MVVSQDKAEAIRSHQDIGKSASNAKLKKIFIRETSKLYQNLQLSIQNRKICVIRYTADAIKYYAQNIAKRAVDAGIGVDIFACHLDQCG
jgi:hypothetical protein